jgi:ferredoxin-NADP reductase
MQSDMRPENPTMGLPVVSPANMLPVQVVDRVEIAPGVVSVFIVLPGTRQAPTPYLPGQFVTLALPTRRETLYRSYSLCGDGDADQPWELTIKRLEMGAVSTYFYNHVVEGTLLYSSLPRGTFTLPAGLRPNMPLVFVAAGSGITPIMGMLRALALLHPDDRPLAQLHYASRTEEDVIFGDDLDRLDPHGTWLRQYHYLSSEGRRMTVEEITARAGSAAARAHWYVCGPDSLKRDLQKSLASLGAPPDRFHSEAFGTGPGKPAYKVMGNEADAAGGNIRVAETGAELDVQPAETVLAALERHGYHPSFSCRAGACGECKLKLLVGQVSPVGEALTASEREEGYILSCIARPMGEIMLASGGRPPAGVARVSPKFAASASGRRPAAVTGVRLASLFGASALLLGSWQLTDHRPFSWSWGTFAPAPPTATAGPGATNTLAPGQTAAPTNTLAPGQTAAATAVPTNTLLPGQSPVPTNTPAPTNTPKPGSTATPTSPPAPTATPKPTPKATCTPTQGGTSHC